MTTYLTTRYGDIDVCWHPDLDGGGRHVGQNFNLIVEHLFGKVNRVFEACSGPGFIGFSLLANDLCDSVVFADVNPDAVTAIKETVKRCSLEKKVTVYQSDALRNIPDEESCDLFVINPPGSRSPISVYVSEESRYDSPEILSINPDDDNPEGALVPKLIAEDLGWQLHRRIYQSASRYLRPGGSILMLENSMLSRPDEFIPMINEGDLEHVRNIWCGFNNWPTVYCMWSKKVPRGLLPNETESKSSTVLDLTETPDRTHTLSENSVLSICLYNKTGSARSVDICDDTGGPLNGFVPPLPMVAPEQRINVPDMALSTGKYSIRDRETGVVLSRFEVNAT